MNALLMALSLFLFQINTMNTLTAEPIAHLQPNRAAITPDFGFKLVELLNAPAAISLPGTPPPANAQGTAWLVDVKNLGPGAVKINGKANFTVSLLPGQTVHIKSDGARYFIVH